jgi:hypothetical protein
VPCAVAWWVDRKGHCLWRVGYATAAISRENIRRDDQRDTLELHYKYTTYRSRVFPYWSHSSQRETFERGIPPPFPFPTRRCSDPAATPSPTALATSHPSRRESFTRTDRV